MFDLLETILGALLSPVPPPEAAEQEKDRNWDLDVRLTMQTLIPAR